MVEPHSDVQSNINQSFTIQLGVVLIIRNYISYLDFIYLYCWVQTFTMKLLIKLRRTEVRSDETRDSQ